jgi:osmotically-inducible protein OsmY
MRSEDRSTFAAAACRTAAAALLAIAIAACGRSDADLQADLQKQLAADPALAGVPLTVEVTKGIAQIGGSTQTKAQQDRAVAIARTIKGLTGVESAMHIDDGVLTAEVKKAIAAEPAVREVPLRIEVHDGEVTFYSNRTNATERARLAEVAMSVAGVRHVVDNMK